MSTAPANAGVTDRQRIFCELVVGGFPAGRAYERAGYSARGDSADQAGSRLLGNVKVSAYLAKLRAEACVAAGKSRDDLVNRLWQIIETPAGKIGDDHALAQGWTIDGRVVMPSKLAAAKQLADIMGWSRPAEQPPAPVEIKVTIGGDV